MELAIANNLTNLTSLNLMDSDISNKGTAAIKEHLTNLRNLI